MFKRIGDGGRLHVARFGFQNYYNHNTQTHEHGFGITDIVDRNGQGLKFENKAAMNNFLERNPRIQFDENGIFMIHDVKHNGNSPFLIVEYDGYVYSVYLRDLQFMALYDKKTCDFLNGLL